MRTYRRMVAAGAAFLALSAGAYAQQQYNAGPFLFQRSGHNQWGAPGEEGLLDWTKTTGWGTWSQNFGIFVGPTDPVDLESGAGITFNLGAEAGVNIQVTGKNGTANVKYPAAIQLVYPDPGTVKPGDSFTISSSFTRGAGGSLTTTPPDFGFKLRGILNVQASADARVKLVGAELFNENIFDTGTIDLGVSIIDTDLPFFRQALDGQHFELLGGIIEGDFGFPQISTSGGNGPGKSLVSSGEDDLITLDASITDAVLALLGAPIDLNGQGSVADGALSWEFHLLDLYLQGSFSLLQSFTFEPKPLISLQLPNGEVKQFLAGDSITLTMPMPSGDAAANNLTLAPTFGMEGDLTNKTDARFAIGMFFDPLSGSLTVDIDVAEGTLDLHIIDPIEIFNETVDFPVMSKTFPVKGFTSNTATPFTVEGYRFPSPTLASLSPKLVKLGSPAFTLTADGANFVAPGVNNNGNPLPGSKLLWGGSERPTTVVNNQTLSAAISAADAGVEGIVQVTVKNPAPGGGTSNPLPVIVDGTPPSISGSASPSVLNRTGNPNILVSVTISGSITDALAGVDPSSTSFTVDDEYNVFDTATATPITLNENGSYSFTVRLSPTRNSKDRDGRLYRIAITAADKLGWVGTKTIDVVVPAN